MTMEEKMTKMFNEIHGVPSLSCYTEVELDEDCNPIYIHLMKDGNICWSMSKADLVFEYLTKDWE